MKVQWFSCRNSPLIWSVLPLTLCSEPCRCLHVSSKKQEQNYRSQRRNSSKIPGRVPNHEKEDVIMEHTQYSSSSRASLATNCPNSCLSCRTRSFSSGFKRLNCRLDDFCPLNRGAGGSGICNVRSSVSFTEADFDSVLLFTRRRLDCEWLESWEHNGGTRKDWF